MLAAASPHHRDSFNKLAKRGMQQVRFPYMAVFYR
jgi:hypothetical protein